MPDEPAIDAAIADTPERRRSYRAPILTPYGTLRDITLAVGMNGSIDGGGGGMMRTRA